MKKEGRLEVITGTMFSGKSTELIRRLNRYEISGLRTILYKPAIDTRYAETAVASHDKLMRQAIPVSTMEEIRMHLSDKTEVLGFDEAQFLPSDIVPFCHEQAQYGRIVIASFLLKNFRDEAFPFMDGKRTVLDLMTIADSITSMTAICTYRETETCGRDASRVQRLQDGKPVPYDSPVVLVGGKESYEPRCRLHFVHYAENKHLIPIR
ncbi:thymidine kinase [Candidatus Woesearchaeota archaeon]|nr:thymidine kinase [Candidatus Woesearchaeota archaeon]